jgi:hypothetical protein
MSVLSFDIGIKNLCYCELSETKQILDWKIIDISNDVPCDHLLKTGKPCCKPATHIYNQNLDNTDIYLCTSHSKHKSYIKIKKFKNPKNNLFFIGQNLVNNMDKLNLCSRNIRSVIVENQPSLKNPTMKSIQMMVYSYFIINGVCNKDSTIEQLDMINARNKLKVYKGPEIQCDIKETYKRNKWLAVKYCDYMIKDENDKFIKLFNDSKKKDDLSDAYLQGIYFLSL